MKDGSPKKPGGPPHKRPSRGRPPRHQGERLSKNRTFRVRGSLDEKLHTAATASGRSVSEEIEFRLDQSFDRDAFIGVLLGGDENAKVLQSIAMVMKIESRSGHWIKKVNTADTVRRAVNYIILLHRMTNEEKARLVGEMHQVLPSDQTPESLAYDALKMVREVRFNASADAAHMHFNVGIPGNDGEKK
jgi:hypothetical protein